jgi:hypothetical protein
MKTLRRWRTMVRTLALTVLAAALLPGVALLSERDSSALYSGYSFPPVWGDVDCDGRAAIGDAVKTARYLLGLAVVQPEGCPPIGSQVQVGDDERVFGDLDCSGDIRISDALKMARVLAGLSVHQEPACPLIAAYTHMPGPANDAVDVWTDKEAYSLGEPISVSIAVRNDNPEAMEISFASSQRFDILLTDAELRRIWIWSADRVFAAELGLEKLPPGGELKYAEIWEQANDDGQPVPPGNYLVFGQIPGCSELWDACPAWSPEPVEIVIQ